MTDPEADLVLKPTVPISTVYEVSQVDLPCKSCAASQDSTTLWAPGAQMHQLCRRHSISQPSQLRCEDQSCHMASLPREAGAGHRALCSEHFIQRFQCVRRHHTLPSQEDTETEETQASTQSHIYLRRSRDRTCALAGYTPLESQPLVGSLGYGGCSKHVHGKENPTLEAAKF